MSDVGTFEWLSGESRLGLGTAGCVTVVSDAVSDDALRDFGVDPEFGVVPVGVAGSESAPALAGVLGVTGGVVIVEPNGFQGARQEVLRRVSKKRAAASVQWGVSGSVYLGCARGGRVVCLTDLLLDDDLSTIPSRLRRLVPADRVAADLVAIGATMAARYVGLTFTEADLDQIDTLRVLTPILGDLLLLPPSMTGLRYDHPGLLRMLVNADSETQRALMEWSAAQAVVQAGLAADERVRQMTAQFGSGRPAVLTSGLMTLAQLAERDLARAEIRDPFRRVDQPASGLEYGWAWQRKAATDALRYCCETDLLPAAIGAVDAGQGCASINHAEVAFVAEANQLLLTDRSLWAARPNPLPDPPTDQQRAAELEAELARVAESEAAERPWSWDLPK